MCKISDQLKLCTCHAVEEEPETHYWVLYRYRESNMLTVGEVMLPPQFYPEIEQYNHDALARLLNQENCFDFEVRLEENDRLELNLRVKPGQEEHLIKGETCGPKFVSYEFGYKNGKWIDAEWNPFNNNLTKKMQGKIANAFREESES